MTDKNKAAPLPEGLPPQDEPLDLDEYTIRDWAVRRAALREAAEKCDEIAKRSLVISGIVNGAAEARNAIRALADTARAGEER